MNTIRAAVCCCVFLLMCLTEASSIRHFLNSQAKLKHQTKFNVDDLSSLTNDDSSYAFLEGKSTDVPRVVIPEEPRFLQQMQTPTVVAADPQTQIPQTQTPTQTVPQLAPVLVSGSGIPGLQLTKTPTTPPSDSQIPEEEEDPEGAKLSAALEAVKEDIVGNSKKIADEKKWVTAVRAITTSYEDKMKRVNDHILLLRQQQKKLFDKKKQIENLKLQNKLQKKLVLASEELKTLQSSLDSVQQKSHELNQEHSNLQTTIKKIESQLSKLKGVEQKKEKGDEEKNDEKEEKGKEKDESSSDSKKDTDALFF